MSQKQSIIDPNNDNDVFEIKLNKKNHINICRSKSVVYGVGAQLTQINFISLKSTSNSLSIYADEL